MSERWFVTGGRMSWQAAGISVFVVVLTAFLVRLPPVAGVVSRASATLLDIGRRRPIIVAVVVGFTWMAWLGGAMWRDGRLAIPRSHDEQSYLLQARIFAEGHLCLPTPKAADFFDTFHVLVRPVYASRYPPGTALVHAPALWLGLPWIATTFAIAGAAMATIA